MKTKSSKHKQETSKSSSSESESNSDSSSSAASDSKRRKNKSSKSSKSTKTKPSKRDRSSDDSDNYKDKKIVKIVKDEADTSKWDSPVNVEIPKPTKSDGPVEKQSDEEPETTRHKGESRHRRRNSEDEGTSKKNVERYEERDRDSYYDRKNDRMKKDKQRERDRSNEDRNRDGRHRNDNPRGGGSYDDRRQQNFARRSRERSPYRDNRRGYNNRDRNRDGKRRRSNTPDNSNYAWGKTESEDTKQNVKTEKEKPNFQLSGKLTEETNTYRGVVIKYSEPQDSRKPKRRWRLYPFKGEKAMQTLYIHRQSAYLMGRDRKIVDLPLDHPSCSKQHAVLQYRLVPFTRDDGSSGKRVRPYIIDLESANGTFINNNKIDPKKYVELLEKDVIKFGYSSREYVMLHENSKDDALDDDVKQEEEEVETVKEEPKD